MRENVILREEPKFVMPINRTLNDSREKLLLTPDMQKSIGFIFYGPSPNVIGGDTALATYLSTKHEYILPSGAEIAKATSMTNYIKPNALNEPSIRQILEFAHMISISNFFCNKSFQSWVATEMKRIEREELKSKCGRGFSSPYDNPLTFYDDPGFEPIPEIAPHFDNSLGPLGKTFIRYDYFRIFRLSEGMGIRCKYTKVFELKDPSKDFIFIVEKSLVTEDTPEDLAILTSQPIRLGPNQLVSNLGIAHINLCYNDVFMPRLICIV